MHSDFRESSAGASVLVLLDGQPVPVPPERRSLPAIRSYLERVAMEKQRILYAFTVDGKPASKETAASADESFGRIEAETIDLSQMPLQLIRMALRQAVRARAQVQTAVALALINDEQWAREHWWNLTRELKHPLLTLSLIPEDVCKVAKGSASLLQCRKWQLQQLAGIMRDVDETCWSDDPMALSNALEKRVLPWLDALRRSLKLWHDTLSLKHPSSGR